MLINLQEIKDFVSISAVADYLGLEEEYGKRKFPGERTASIELYPNTQTFYDFGRAVGGDIFDLLSHIKGIGFKEALDEIVDFFKIEVSTSENEETSRPRWINYLEEKKKCRYIEHYNYSLISLKGEYLGYAFTKVRVMHQIKKKDDNGDEVLIWDKTLIYGTLNLCKCSARSEEYHQECEKKKMVYSKSVLPWRARDTVLMVVTQRNVQRMSSGSVRKLRQVCIIPTKI